MRRAIDGYLTPVSWGTALTGNYRRQLGLTAASWLVWELAAVAQTKAIANGFGLLAAALSLALPLIGFASSIWFIEEKTWKGRLGLTLAGAAGAAMGTLAVMALWGG